MLKRSIFDSDVAAWEKKKREDRFPTGEKKKKEKKGEGSPWHYRKLCLSTSPSPRETRPAERDKHYQSSSVHGFLMVCVAADHILLMMNIPTLGSLEKLAESFVVYIYTIYHPSLQRMEARKRE